jgi:hypothetical protein
MSKIIKAVKKPVTVEALQYLGTEESVRDVLEFVGEKVESNNGLIIKTLEGQHIASVGDYIIKGVKGEFYPCKPDIFEMTYDIKPL